MSRSTLYPPVSAPILTQAPVGAAIMMVDEASSARILSKNKSKTERTHMKCSLGSTSAKCDATTLLHNLPEAKVPTKVLGTPQLGSAKPSTGTLWKSPTESLIAPTKAQRATQSTSGRSNEGADADRLVADHIARLGFVPQARVKTGADETGQRTIYADFRCRCGVDGQGRLNSMIFHRIVDCFVPMLPLLREVTVESALQRAKVVAIVDNSTLPFYQLFGPAGAQYLSPPAQPRSKQLEWFPATLRSKANLFLTKATSEGARLHRTDLRPTVVLHEYARRWLGSGGDAMRVGLRSTLLVQRGAQAGRAFTNQTMLAMQQRFAAQGAGALVSVYRGTEPLRETLQKFYDAGVVVHYHGAASANLVFAHSACVFELTACTTLPSGCAKLPNPSMAEGLPPPGVDFLQINNPESSSFWRTNAFPVMAQNPLLRWHVMGLPLLQLLETNGLDMQTWERVVHSGQGHAAADTLAVVCQQLRGTSAADAVTHCRDREQVSRQIADMARRSTKKGGGLAEPEYVASQMLKSLALVELTPRQLDVLGEQAAACLSAARLPLPEARPWYSFQPLPQ